MVRQIIHRVQAHDNGHDGARKQNLHDIYAYAYVLYMRMRMYYICVCVCIIYVYAYYLG